MDEYSVKRLGLILAIQAEIEGMKVENTEREINDYAPAYNNNSFIEKADELRVVVSKHDYEL